MNRKFFFLIFFVYLSISALFLVSVIRTIYVNSVKSIAAASVEIHSIYINEIIYNFKNDLVSENYRGFRNQIATLVDRDVFSDYKITKAGLTVEASDSFDRNKILDGYVLIRIPIWFDEARTTLWGDVSLLVKSSSRVRLENIIFQSLVNYGLWFLLVVIVMTGVTVLLWLSSNRVLNIAVNKIFDGAVEEEIYRSARLWKPMMQQIFHLKNHRDSLLQKEFIDQQERMFIQIARSVAHDIRSPLSALKIASSFVPKSSSEVHDLIVNSVERINKIAEELLNTSKGFNFDFYDQQYSFSSKVELTDIGDTLSKLIREKRSRLSADAKIDLLLKTTDQPVLINLNSSAFERAISNLVENSLDAVAVSGGRVIIELIRQGSTIVLSIVDNGVGIPSDVLERLGSAPITFGKNENGNGLGFIGSKNSLIRMGWSVEVSSKLGVGTGILLRFELT